MAQMPAPVQAPDRIMESLSQAPLCPSLEQNLCHLASIFDRCADLVVHHISPSSGPKGCILYVDGLVKKDYIQQELLSPLIQKGLLPNLNQVATGTTSLSEVRLLHTLGDVVERVLSGDAVLLVDTTPYGLGYGVQGWKSRAVEEPVTEATIRGPREGFVESLSLNTALIRRKIKSPALKIESLTIGRITQTQVAVAYVEGLANPEVIQELFCRLKRIDIDGVLEGGHLEEFIEDSTFSPFPQLQNTERPDTVAGNLLEGRIAVLVDGSPFALLLPVVFTQFMQVSEDYYERFLIGTALRFLRYVALLVALLMPSLYIAVITYHPEMLPTNLLLSVAAAREGIPFPALVEASIMEITFEVLREAGIRLPRPVGQAVSIVGALVIGESAVRAGLASAPMVIIVSLTGIASFAIPRYNAGIAIRLLRFPLMLLAGSLGMLGIVAGLSAILLHLCSLRSFGVPYLTPMAPLNLQGLKDSLIRSPIWWMRRRPRLIGHHNPIRVAADQRPGADQGTEQ